MPGSLASQGLLSQIAPFFVSAYLLMPEKEIGPVALVAQSIYNPFGQGRFGRQSNILARKL